MLYGERLKLAMEHRSAQLGQKVTQTELAKAAGCAPQNISMILSNARGDDQKLNSDNHAKAAAFLKVNPDWLLSELGDMEQAVAQGAPANLSAAAFELATLFDMIPQPDRIRRAMAFNAASSAILAVLQS